MITFQYVLYNATQPNPVANCLYFSTDDEKREKKKRQGLGGGVTQTCFFHLASFFLLILMATTAFHEGDERPEEFSVLVRTAAGWAVSFRTHFCFSYALIVGTHFAGPLRKGGGGRGAVELT